MKDILTNLSFLGLLRVSGLDAKKLLQGQFTCNIEEINHARSLLGAHCNPQGRILSLVRIFMYADDYYLQMPADILAATKKALEKYAVFYKVKLEDASSNLSRLSYSGPQAETHLASLFPELPTEVNTSLQNNNISIIKLPGLNPHYEILGSDTLFLEKTLMSHTEIGTENDWKQINITAGIPNIYANTIAKLLPHEINLQLINGISFDKGCYTGQEIIARMHYRGQLKKHMYRAHVPSPALPQPGADIYAGQACGIIVDSCQETDDLYQILLITDQALVKTKQLFLDPKETEPVEFLPLPYEF